MAEDKKDLNETMNEDQFLTLEWDDGSSVECEIIDDIELDGKKYVALLPIDEDQAIIFSYVEEEDGEIQLGNLEDEEFDKVSQAFLDNYPEEEEE